MERKTHFERVVGGNEKDRQDASRELQEIFDEPSEKLSKYEIEKTPEDMKIIENIQSLVDEMVIKYGGVVKDLPIDHIHVLKPKGVFKMTEGKLGEGIHIPLQSRVGVEKGESKLLFASTLAHELFHLKSYKSARVGRFGEGALPYRSGLSMYGHKDLNKEEDQEKEYFKHLEEAIVAECTKKLLDKFSEDEILKEEAVAVGRIKNWVIDYHGSIGATGEFFNYIKENIKYINNPQGRVEEILASSDNDKSRRAYAAGMFEALYDEEGVEFSERYWERKKMYDFFDEIVKSSDGIFKNRDEVFDEFAKANFSGNYIPLARVVEGILGKGSFRKMAEDFEML